MTGSYQLPLDLELIVDNFAGGGGASCGIEMALQRPVNIAINHDPEALQMHEANHPLTRHYCEDVWDIDPMEVCKGRPILLAWFSPDCKHFSKAKGGKPVEKRIRGLAWVVMKWADMPRDLRPRVIMLENVEEFTTWGPLDAEGMPDKARKGETFRSFINALRRLGYEVDWRELRHSDHGVRTIRKRLFLIARCDGQPIVWPEVTHAKPGPLQRKAKLKPWRTAAECIEWDVPAPSIFADGRRMLAENTLRRIAKGFKKFVLDSGSPFIVRINHGDSGGRREFPLNEPMMTLTQKLGEALVTPYLTEHANSSTQRNFAANEPLRTQCAQVKGGHFATVNPYFAGVGGRMGQSNPRAVDQEPFQTITAKGDTGLVTPFVVGAGGAEYAGKPRPLDAPFKTATVHDRGALIAPVLASLYGAKNGESRCHDVNEPLNTVTATMRHAILAAHLTKFRGDTPGADLNDPLPTVTAGSFKKRPGGNGHAMGIVASYLVRHFGTSVGSGLNTPQPAVMGKSKDSLIAAYLAQHNNHQGTIPSAGRDMADPLSTITASGAQQQIVAAHITKLKGTCKDGQPVDEPLHTVAAGGQHHALTCAYLVKYYGNEKGGQDMDAPLGTVTTKDRLGLIQVEGAVPPLTDDQRYNAWVTLRMLEQYGAIDVAPQAIPGPRPAFLMLGEYILVDIGMRMLIPRELYRAQGFPDSYIIDRTSRGKPITKTRQVMGVGNSVSPEMARLLASLNVPRHAALSPRKVFA